MATVALPLDSNILEAIEDFNRPNVKVRAIRAATMQVLLEDLQREIEKTLKEAGEI